MKKILTYGLLFLVGLLLITGCGEKELDLTVNEVIDKVMEGLEDNSPMVSNTEVTKENMEYYLGTDTIDIEEGIASEPVMSSIAHSVVVIKVADGTDINAVKEKIKENVNPQKWVCVEAEKVIVENKGNIIILIMSNNDLATKIQENFNNL